MYPRTCLGVTGVEACAPLHPDASDATDVSATRLVAHLPAGRHTIGAAYRLRFAQRPQLSGGVTEARGLDAEHAGIVLELNHPGTDQCRRERRRPGLAGNRTVFQCGPKHS